jgi:tyrosine-protein kinase Etk/Wzc
MSDPKFKNVNPENYFDIKRFFFKILRNYRFIVLSFIVSLLAAQLYLSYKTNLYQVSTYILIAGAEIESNTGDILANAGLGSVFKENITSNAVKNEVFILKTHDLIYKVVDSMSLDVVLGEIGILNEEPVYLDLAPFTINVKRGNPVKNSPEYKLNIINDSSFVLEGGEVDFKGVFGKDILVNGDIIRLTRKPGKPLSKKTYALQFLGLGNAVAQAIARVEVLPEKQAGAGMLKISVTDEIPERAEKFTEVLIHLYNVSNLSYKTQAIHRALLFLNNRLASVSDELNDQEIQVQNFKVKNQIYNVSSSAETMVGNLEGLDKKLNENEFKSTLLSLVEENVKSYDGRKAEIVANAAGLQDPVLTDLVTKYNQSVLAKRLVLDEGTDKDPRLKPIDGQMETLRENIIKTVAGIRSVLTEDKNNLKEQENRFTRRFESLPGKEKDLINVNRKLAVKESLYEFLLRKKEETEIQLVSSDFVKSRTVDNALNNGIIEPVASKIYLMFGFFGFLLPSVIIFIRLMSNDKIETKKDIEDRSSLPIAGEINHSNEHGIMVTSAKTRTAIAEQFRALRINLSYIGQQTAKKVYLITSTISGEGKSFVSLNLANTLSLSDKKVVLIELDLRKPKLSSQLGVKTAKGISSYIAANLTPEEIVVPLKDFPNLYLISSGPIPPNPGELILSNKMAELFAYLRANFDYVIVDSAPVGLVSDAITIGKHVDSSLYIIRQDYSSIHSMRLINELKEDDKLPNPALIINGIKVEKGLFKGAYGYGYGYGYGSHAYGEYDSEVNQNGIIKKIKGLFGIG